MCPFKIINNLNFVNAFTAPTIQCAQHKIHISIIYFLVCNAADVVVACIVAVVVFCWTNCSLVALYTTLVAFALKRASAMWVSAAS